MTKKKQQQYTADTIEVNSNLMHIRHRPTAYLVSKGTAGQIQMIRELIDNSIDEIILKPEGGVIWISILRDRVKEKYQILVRDTGRGIPKDQLENCVTIVGASGKVHENSAYVASGGLFGIGGKVPVALSSRYRVISHNYLEAETGDIYIEDAVIKHKNLSNANAPVGCTILFEPDLKQFFEDSSEFIESGYLDLVHICRQLNIFNSGINFQIYLFDRLIPESWWTNPVAESLEEIDKFLYKRNKEILYAADTVADKVSYLFNLWKVSSSVIHQDTFVKSSTSPEDRLSYDIKLFFTKKSATGNPQYFVTINNIALIDRTENSATTVVMHVLRNQIAAKIEDKNFSKFVLEDYRFPTLLLAIGIRYNNAELSGTTKTTFIDNVFAKQFMEELTLFISLLGDEYWTKVTNLLMPDIELRYNQFYDTPPKRSETKNIFTHLNFNRNYEECQSGDATRCELYIVEGTSAGNIVGTRNKLYQAIYETRGKPLNPATTLDQIDANRKKILQDPVYKDIMTIMNINDKTRDISTARFHKLIITTDADSEGYHIRSSHLNNLYIINPLFITSGIVWLANPPLYSMEIGHNKRLFLRDKTALMDARIRFIYQPTLDIKVKTADKIITPDPVLYRELCYLVNHIGDHFQVVANQLNIPLLVLERFVYAVEYLYPFINYPSLEECFNSCDPTGYVRLQIHKNAKYVVITIGHEDFPVGLDQIGETIIKQLLPLVKKYKYRNYVFYVSSKHKGATIQNQMMSMMMLYQCFDQLNKMFNMRRYKGLGQMDSADCAETLMNPETRSLTHITSVGDLQMSYDLLGSDPTKRKELLQETTILSNLFGK